MKKRKEPFLFYQVGVVSKTHDIDRTRSRWYIHTARRMKNVALHYRTLIPLVGTDLSPVTDWMQSVGARHLESQIPNIFHISFYIFPLFF